MIGNLRNRIELLAASRTVDAGGGAAVGYGVAASMWARVERLPSTTGLAGDRNVRLRRAAASIRRRADLAPGDRFRFDGVDYEIMSIEDDAADRHRVLLIGEEAAP
ncbi:MAG: hypothetical protein GC152_03455 [Alphaproteobacteria bacterium]|nr:hypothetical protein [Alphaproteobacteria bacterium]